MVRDVALLVALAVPVLFVRLDLGFLDPDEGLYADIAYRMFVSGDWVLPRFNGLPYLEKPPLLFWLTAPLAGWWATEWAVRAVSALAALGTAVLTRAIGARLYDARAGFRAGLALVTMAGIALYVRKASTDLLFVFCLTLTVWGFVADVARPERGARRFLWMYAGIALGLLTKGLIGIVLPAAIIALALAWTRRLGPGDLNLGRGLALAGAIALPWHVAVAWRVPDLFWFYLVDNQILRFLGVRGFIEDDVPVSTVGFLVVTFVWLFPWSVFALARSATPAPEPWRPVLAIWAIVVVAFFAAARSKLEYYALPAFPAVAVLAGAAWSPGGRVGRWLLAGGAGSTLVGIALLWLGPRLTADQALAGLAELNVYYRIRQEQGLGLPVAVGDLARLITWLGVVLVAGWAVATAAWVRGARRTSFAAVTGVAIAIGVLIVELLRVVEPHHSAQPIAAAINARADEGDVIAHEGSLEYSAALPFYTGRRVVVVNGTRGDLDLASRLPEGRGQFVDTAGLAALWGGGRRVFLVTRSPAPQSVAGTLPPATLHSVGRFGSRWLYSNRPLPNGRD